MLLLHVISQAITVNEVAYISNVFFHKLFHDLKLRLLSVASTSQLSHVSHVVITNCRKKEKCHVGMVFNFTTPLLNFVKVGSMIQLFKRAIFKQGRGRDHGDLIRPACFLAS
jgi:hypothetical protein